MRSSDRGADGYVRADAASGLLVLGIAAAVLWFGVSTHGAWDPHEVDAMAREPARLIAWLLRLGLDRRAAHAVVGCATVLVVARGAGLLGGRRAALVGACVALSMPGLVLGARLVTIPLHLTLGAAMLVVATIGAVIPGRRNGRWIDVTLGLAGAAICSESDPVAALVPVAACASALLARRASGRIVPALAVAAAALCATAALASARAPDAAGGWARAIEPGVYGALPWIAIAPWAALQTLGGRRLRAGAVALVVWAALGPWLSADAPLWLPASVLCGVAASRGLRMGPAIAIAIAAAVALGLDVHRSAAGLIGVATDGPAPTLEGLAEGWRYVGFIGAPLAALAALARGRPRVLGVLCAASVTLGFVLAHAWLPALSARLSHESLFAELPAGSPLGVLGMRAPSARFWTRSEPQELTSGGAVLSFLQSPRAAYAAVPRDAFCAIRQRARSEGRALFTTSADPRFLLLSNRPPTTSHDPLEDAISAQAPSRTGRAVTARLEHVDLIGVTLPASARRGSRVDAALHFHVRERLPRDLRVLVHVEGPGPRFQGDHDPVDGACPTSQWLPGDYVNDRFSFSAGTLTHAPGRYAVYVGLYWGAPGRWTNLPVLEGSGDRFDRVAAGELELR